MKNGSPSRERTLLLRPFAHEFSQRILDDSKGESASFPLRVLKSCKPQEPLAKLALFKLARWSYPRNSRILSCPLQKAMGGKVPSRVGRKRAVLDSFHYPVLSFPFLSVPSSICSIMFHHIPSSFYLLSIFQSRASCYSEQTNSDRQ
jgi:hypothetical protein